MSDRFVFDPRDERYKSPFGAVPCGGAVSFTLRPLSGEGFCACLSSGLLPPGLPEAPGPGLLWPANPGFPPGLPEAGREAPLLSRNVFGPLSPGRRSLCSG